MDNFSKVVRIGTVDEYQRPGVDVFCKIEFRDGKLSISGVVGPNKNGDAIGSCGQICMSYETHEERSRITPAPQWTADMIERFFSTWERWHLNDMRAGSPSQSEWLRANPIQKQDYAYPKSHYDVACDRLAAAGLNPDASGYRYGSAWNTEEVPADVLEWLRSLPDSDKHPAWV